MIRHYDKNIKLIVEQLFEICYEQSICLNLHIDYDYVLYTFSFSKNDKKKTAYIYKLYNCQRFTHIDKYITENDLINKTKLGNIIHNNYDICNECKSNKQVYVHFQNINNVETFCAHKPYINIEIMIFIDEILDK